MKSNGLFVLALFIIISALTAAMAPLSVFAATDPAASVSSGLSGMKAKLSSENISDTKNNPASAKAAVAPAPAAAKKSLWDKTKELAKKAGQKSLGWLQGGLKIFTEVFTRPLQQGVGKLVSTGSDAVDYIGEKITPKRVSDAPADMKSVEGISKAIENEFDIKVRASKNGKWTVEELKGVYEALKKLPADFREHTKVIQRDAESQRAEGYVTSFIPGTVHLCGTTYYVKETMVHEMMHCYQFANMHTTNDFNRQFFGNRIGYIARGGNAKTKSVTEYGDTNSLEDGAESVREYFENPTNMKKTNPDRYEFVKTRIMRDVEFTR